MNDLMIKFPSCPIRKTITNLLFGVFALFLVIACQPIVNHKIQIEKADKLVLSGEMKSAGLLDDSLKVNGGLDKTEMRQLDSIIEIGRRVQLDFCLSEPEMKRQLSKYFPELDSMQIRKWENSRKLETRMIDGEKRYFKNAVSNLFLLDDQAAKQRNAVDGCRTDSLKLFCLNHTEKIIQETKISGETVSPVRMKLKYTIQVKPNAVPGGETIRCWMPFPRTGNARQKNIQLIRSDPENALVAPESDLQRSVYLEKKAIKDQPTIFQIELEVETAAQYFDLNPEQIKPYDSQSAVYKEFTSERPPQITFTPEIRKLGDRIVSGETNPLKKVQKIYNWINDTIRWASALEYGTMPDIPGYVLENGHGDCGMQTLLFMTLARSQGIPAKWQSGWMLHPHEVNLHDWCEVYYEGIGWVPLDQSFGLQASADEKIRNFYRSGIDSYRLIVNDDYGRKLSPKKKFIRSEPYDFQRGELEWEGGNLYFDQWTWHMDVSYE